MSDVLNPDPKPSEAVDEPVQQVDGSGTGTRRAISRLVGRASLNLIDQGLSALTNVALAFIVARAMGASSFGAFSVAFLVFSLFIGVERSLVGQPMSIRFSGAEGEERSRAVGAAIATVLSLTFVGGALIAVGGAVIGGPLGASLLALAPVLIGLITQDACRMTFFAQRRPHLAVLNDVVWTVAQFATIGVLYARGVDQAWPYVMAWGISATLAALLGVAQLGVRPRFHEVAWWVRSQLDITGYLLFEYLLGAASAQGSILLVGAVGSLTDVGSLRAAQTLLGPLGIVASATMTFLLPEVSRRADMSPRNRHRVSTGVSAVMVLGSLAYAAVLLLIPDALGRQLLGDTWVGARTVLLPMALASAAAAASLGPAILIYGMGQARKTFRLHAIEAPLIVVCMTTGLHLGGTPGAAWGMALSMTLMIPFWFAQLIALTRRETTS